MNSPVVRIIGAGLAGSEAAFALASRGKRVRVYEMRPKVMTKAHKTSKCAELVCSNSFRGSALTNAVGLLKAELRLLGALIMEAANHAEVPAGGALAVDREVFSGYVDLKIRNHPLIEFVTEEIEEIPEANIDSPLIVATGPLTSKALCRSISALTGVGNLAFFDAISPIILGNSIDMSLVYRKSRYEKGGGEDYLNIPLTKEEYLAFVDEISKGEKYGGHEEIESDVVDDLRPFEGCMPIEEMVSRGPETLRFGPLKPVGLRHPVTGVTPYAVIQLRQDNKDGTLWSMVGMQTRLKHPEQIRIFGSIPALRDAEYVRLGSVHRNTFIDSPKCLNPTLEFRTKPGLFFAGQIIGVEGYVESAAAGLVAGLNASRLLDGKELIQFPSSTAIGGLLHYISDPERTEFQPMNISFGLISGYSELKSMPKTHKRTVAANRALKEIEARRAENL